MSISIWTRTEPPGRRGCGASRRPKHDGTRRLGLGLWVVALIFPNDLDRVTLACDVPATRSIASSHSGGGVHNHIGDVVGRGSFLSERRDPVVTLALEGGRSPTASAWSRTTTSTSDGARWRSSGAVIPELYRLTRMSRNTRIAGEVDDLIGTPFDLRRLIQGPGRARSTRYLVPSYAGIEASAKLDQGGKKRPLQQPRRSSRPSLQRPLQVRSGCQHHSEPTMPRLGPALQLEDDVVKRPWNSPSAPFAINRDYRAVVRSLAASPVLFFICRRDVRHRAPSRCGGLSSTAFSSA